VVTAIAVVYVWRRLLLRPDLGLPDGGPETARANPTETQ
jgi:hypothetical protein